MNDKEISDFITLPRTFEKYRWYKPILIFIIGFILMIIFQLLIEEIFSGFYGHDFVDNLMNGGYEVLNNTVAELFSDLEIIIMMPALYLASKIVRERPFSSYISTSGRWNFKLYLKALAIPLVLFIVFNAIDAAITGPEGTFQFSLLYLIVLIIFLPLQCIAEELVYRGFLMQAFGSWFKIPVVAIILQSVIFTISHGYNTFGLVEIFVSGIVFGFFTWKTNGIEVSSALHTANNLSLSLFVMLGIITPTSSPQLWESVVAIVFVVLLGVLMYFIGNKTDWFGEIPG
ncbi:CPBP family intramembrane glutamic endopeptidase [Methanobrevibacter sp.]